VRVKTRITEALITTTDELVICGPVNGVCSCMVLSRLCPDCCLGNRHSVGW